MEGKLSDENMFQCLKSLNVPVRLNDIKTPTREFVIRVLDCFIKDQQFSLSISDRNFDATQHIEHPELFPDTFSLIQLIRLINKITRIDNFEAKLTDIMEPRPKRTKRLLNHLILYWNHSLQKNINFQNVEQSIIEERKKAEDLQNEISILQGEKENCSSALEKLSLDKELYECVPVKREEYEKLEKEHKVLAEEYEQVVKKKEKELTEKNKKLEIDILTMKEKITDIEPLILSSPDRLTKELQKIKDIIKAEEIKCREKELELKNKKKIVDTSLKTYETNKKSLETLKEIKISLEDLSKFVESSKSVCAALEKEDEQLKKIRLEIEKKDTLKDGYKETEMKISLNFCKHKDSMKKNFESLEIKTASKLNSLELLKAKNTEYELKVEKVVESVLKIVNLHQKAEVITEKKQSEYLSMVDELLATFTDDCKEVKEMMKTFYKF